MCKKLIFLISFVVILGLVGNAFATERHVGPGERLTTIEAAYNASSAGDIITIHENTDGSALAYTMAGFLKNDDSKHGITFRAYHDGTKYDNIVITSSMEVAYKTGWTFEGFILSSNGSNYGFIQWERAGFTNGWHMVKNCIFHNMGTQTVYYYSNYSDRFSRNVTIENCTFINQTCQYGIYLNKYAYDWTVKDCIFQNIKYWDQSGTDWGGTAFRARNGTNVYADFCTFYNNGEDMPPFDPLNPNGTQAFYGTYATTDRAVEFANSTQPFDENFGYLTYNNSWAVLRGSSDYSYRGARPTPEPATIALLGLGGLVLLRKRR